MEEIRSKVNIIPYSETQFDVKQIDDGTSYGYHAYFKDKHGHLLGLFEFHILDSPIVGVINDSTSSSSFNHFSDSMKSIYYENGFNSDYILEKGSAQKMLEQVLTHIYNNFPEVIWINFSEDDEGKNGERLKKLIDSTAKSCCIILDTRGSSGYAWTIRIR